MGLPLGSLGPVWLVPHKDELKTLIKLQLCIQSCLLIVNHLSIEV
jgi:hypothetical protein